MTSEVVRAGVQRARKRMGVERIDLMQFHWWHFDHPQYLDAMAELAALREEGLIAHLGLTNFDTAHLRLLLADAPTRASLVLPATPAVVIVDAHLARARGRVLVIVVVVAVICLETLESRIVVICSDLIVVIALYVVCLDLFSSPPAFNCARTPHYSSRRFVDATFNVKYGLI